MDVRLAFYIIALFFTHKYDTVDEPRYIQM